MELIPVAKLRHIAIAVNDLEAASRFYQETFEMVVAGETESPIASGVYLTDGTVCLALLNYKTDEAAGLERGKEYVGVHHFGFWCDDLDEQGKLIEANGGRFFMDLPLAKDSLYYEAKYRDPDGVIFDISENGWVGAAK
ncbi:VOC family protein [Actinomadura soli]|uniref:VOC family protein n=1 Tax=Actinomadura soli TaxID=2508997 RepID=A0A5C4JCK9_9ACTN|nr:VOC family protein [Actinomadura soli]